MLRAVVVDNVWATRRLAELPNGALLEVQVEDTGARLVAFDVLGSGIGERVLVAQGSVAAAWFPGKPPPLDALIVGSIDEPTRRVVADHDPADVVPVPGSPTGSDPAPAPDKTSRPAHAAPEPAAAQWPTESETATPFFEAPNDSSGAAPEGS